LLSLALCWTFLTGKWLHQLKPLALKKHGRRAKSLFRYDFDYLRNIVLNLEQKRDDILGRFAIFVLYVGFAHKQITGT
jgi:hypothetical protein